MPRAKPNAEPKLLTGWQEIAEFLGQPINVAQRWGREGMPVSRKGRFVVASPDELNKWLGREAGEPIRVASDSTDLVKELKEGLKFVRQDKRKHRAKES